MNPEKNNEISGLEKIKALKQEQELKRLETESQKKQSEEQEELAKSSQYKTENEELTKMTSRREEILKRLAEIKSQRGDIIKTGHKAVEEARQDEEIEKILHTKEGFDEVFSNEKTEWKNLQEEVSNLNEEIKNLENLDSIREYNGILNSSNLEEILSKGENKETPLYTFNSFEDFKNDNEIVKPGVEFEPNSVKFKVTDDSIKLYASMFNDLFPPHVILEEGSISAASKVLSGEYKEKPTVFFQGIGTLSYLNGFVRRIFQFKDKTELLTPGFNKIRFPSPNPSGSNITSKWKILEKKTKTINTPDRPMEAVEIIFEAKVYSDKIEPRQNETEARPVCIAEWIMLYIPHKE